jgi:TAP42-like family
MHPDREFSLLHSTTHAQSFLAQCSLFEITPLSIQNREEKIAAYRMQKHIAAEIAKIELNGSMEDWEGDDEVMREYCILSLRSNAQLCIELLGMNAMERRLLEMKVDMPINVTSESEARIERKTQHTGPLLSDKGKVRIQPLPVLIQRPCVHSQLQVARRCKSQCFSTDTPFHQCRSTSIFQEKWRAGIS